MNTITRGFEQQCIPEPMSGCWLWLGTIAPNGYGKIWRGRPRRRESAHVVAYQIYKGPIPRGKIVRHTCDVRCCVNPDHLLLGSYKDNTQDATDRARLVHGSAQWAAKLDAEELKERYDDSESERERLFGRTKQDTQDSDQGSGPA